MRYPAAFTLLHKPVLVRLEPPDVIVVDGLSTGMLRFCRAQLRECRPMRVTNYREAFDPSYLPPCEGETLVLLSIDGVYDGKLGPFPDLDAIDLAESILFAREDLLYGSPDRVLHVRADGAVMVISYRRSATRGLMTVSISIVNVLDLEVRDDAPTEAERNLDTGFRPDHTPRWIALVRTVGKPHVVGPFSARSAAAISRAFAEWRTAHPIDLVPLEVSEGELRADPARFHLRRVRVTGNWYHAFEGSSFANVWLDEPEGLRFENGRGRVVVVGTWIYPNAEATTGYGHMGESPGELRAETIEVLAVDEEGDLRSLNPNETRANFRRRAVDPFTRTHTRWRLEEQLAQEVAAARTTGAPLAVVYLDLDGLGRVNHASGHLTGDTVVREVAARLRAHLRAGDFLARYAGDEFVFLLPDTDLAQAVAQADALRAAVASGPIVHESAPVTITASVGVALADLTNDDPCAAVQTARLRVDDAKARGGDRVGS